MLRFLGQFDVHSLTNADDFYVVERWIFAIGLLGMRELTALVNTRIDAADFEELEDFRDAGYRPFKSLLNEAEQSPYDRGRFDALLISELDQLYDVLRAHRNPRISIEPPPPAEDPEPVRGDVPVVNPWRNVGRNDPCPCGSGRKAKKCCLANTS